MDEPELFGSPTRIVRESWRRLSRLKVEAAIRDLLTTGNPDFLLWWFSVPPGGDQPLLHLEVEATAGLIERDFPLSALIDNSMSGNTCWDGTERIGPEDVEELKAIANALRSEAKRIDDYLERTEVRLFDNAE